MIYENQFQLLNKKNCTIKMQISDKISLHVKHLKTTLSER